MREGLLMKKVKSTFWVLITMVFIMSIHAKASTIQYVDFGTMPNGDYIIGVGTTSAFAGRTVNGDLYVRKGAEHTFYGNMTVTGDVYILGDFYNQGVITVGGTVYFLNYYENNQLIMQALRDIDGVPSGFYYGNLHNNGTIYCENMIANPDIAFIDIPLVPIEIKTECEKGNHTPGSPATCTTSQVCTKCGIILQEPLGHYSVHYATCTEPEVCARCGGIISDALGHNPGLPATCQQAQRCTQCNAILAPAISHTPGEWTVSKKATCQSFGEKIRKCVICGKITDVKSVQKKNHVSGKWEIIKPATGTKKGQKQKKCTFCGIILETSTIPKTVVKLNVSTLPLQLKKSTTALKVTSISAGDKIKSWTSSNNKIVSVNKKTGKLTAKKTGKAKITVITNTGAKATCTVTVQKGAVKTNKLLIDKKTITLKKGKAYNIKVVRNPITANDKITYKTSNKKLVTVNSKGQVVAKKKGSATITVKAGKATVKVKVLVK